MDTPQVKPVRRGFWSSFEEVGAENRAGYNLCMGLQWARECAFCRTGLK